MAIHERTGKRFELVAMSGRVTTFRLRIFDSEDDDIGYLLTTRGKRDAKNPLAKKALAALSETWPQATVKFTADDQDRQILTIEVS